MKVSMFILISRRGQCLPKGFSICFAVHTLALAVVIIVVVVFRELSRIAWDADARDAQPVVVVVFAKDDAVCAHSLAVDMRGAGQRALLDRVGHRVLARRR